MSNLDSIRVSRPRCRVLALTVTISIIVFGGIDAGVAVAQTVNPRVVSFVPSPDHSTIGSDGQPIVSEYDLEFYPVGGSQTLLVLNLGKPDPAADGYISVDFASLLASPPSPGQQLEARVAAVGPGGKGESSPSNSFLFDCTAAVAPTSFSAPSQGGSGSLSVTTYAGCSWQAASAVSWITITSGASGSASGTVTFTAAANPTTSSRVGTISVAGQTATVTEAAATAADAPPSIQLTSPANGAAYNAPASITIAAAASDSDGTVTNVAFYVNSTLIGSTASAPYSVPWSNVSAGTYTVTAVATDNSGTKTTSAAAAVTVKAPNVAPTVQLTSPASGATFTAPASITISANAADSDGSVASVAFYANGTLVGTDTASPYSMAWSNVAAGSYTITAVATDNSGGRTTSSGVAVTVKAANLPPTVQLTGPASGAAFTAPASIPISASAADSDGSVTSVAFLANGTQIGVSTAAPYGMTWNNVAAGAYTFTAVATDNSGAKTTSGGVTVTVSAPTAPPANVAPAVQVTNPTNNATLTWPSSTTITATASDSDGSIARVQFYVNGALVGTATASPYQVRWSLGSSGTYTITAVAIDNGGLQTTSSPVIVTVRKKNGKG